MEEAAYRYPYMPRAFKSIFVILTFLGVGAAVYYVFAFNVGGHFLDAFAYYYILFGVFESLVFLLLPARKKDKETIPWYDLAAAAYIFGSSIYFFFNAWSISYVGWVPPTTLNFILATIYALLVLEGGRRMAGFGYLLVALFFMLLPLFANHMTGMFFGKQYSLKTLSGFLVFGGEGLLGIPARVMGEILIGFLVFAAVLMVSGAGDFFLKMASGLVGKYRGGPAKVAAVASGFFGSCSGSAVSNVMGTGCVTIPMMKKIGYEPAYAGAIEAVASTGGILMPPVMGAVAFIMATVINVPYASIIIAATIPAILYYFGVLIQIDGYAAKHQLRGLPQEELPSIRATLKEGWIFLAVIGFLVWGLLYMRWEALTPWYASVLMLVLSYFGPNRITPKKLFPLGALLGRLVVAMTAILAPAAFIIAGLSITGISAAFTVGIITIGGSNLVLLLLVGIAACFIMGMVGLGLVAYILLSVTLAPALIKAAGLNMMAVHLMILYYASLAYITPPVAGVAFVAAALAGSNPMKTAFLSMRLGIVIYFIPLFFVFSPSLILQGSNIVETIYRVLLCLIGITILGGGLEGYMLKLGKLPNWSRPVLALGGFLIAVPIWTANIAGATVTLPVLGAILLGRRMRHAGEAIDIAS